MPFTSTTPRPALAYCIGAFAVQVSSAASAVAASEGLASARHEAVRKARISSSAALFRIIFFP
ncbi:MAG: hypothetical protein NWF09_07895 [Candidatus Bathyarchaeota archaeon]|nr:hypothetical protein [Candidatus Bathyarchaeota archaeon]